MLGRKVRLSKAEYARALRGIEHSIDLALQEIEQLAMGKKIYRDVMTQRKARATSISSSNWSLSSPVSSVAEPASRSATLESGPDESHVPLLTALVRNNIGCICA
eukprot:SAG31_NODE_905_length_11119_cov_2.887931_10_plen_105_part_00